MKLQAQFLKVSAAYLTATPHLADNETYTNDTALTVTALTDKSSSTKFLVLRPSAYESFDTRRYKLQVSTTAGSVTIPQLGGALTLYGHDSKIHVIDYDVGGTNLLYSSAEIFTWKRFANFTVLILYGGPNELHEFAIASTERVSVVEGAPGAHRQHNGITVFQWTTSNTKTVLKLGTLYIYLLGKHIKLIIFTH